MHAGYSFVNLTLEGTSIENMPLSGWRVGKYAEDNLWMMIDMGKLSPLWAVLPLSRWSWVVVRSKLKAPRTASQ